MNKKGALVFLVLSTFLTLASAQEGPNFVFDSVHTEKGTGFYALNMYSGQAYYMWDIGKNPGKWFSYGNTIDQLGRLNLQLNVVRSDEGTGFYALDSFTGQVYYMWDYGDYAGEWYSYGKPLDRTGRGSYDFSIAYTGNGTGFYAYDQISGQMYYMWDVGENAGQWFYYGETLY